jgi:hypothetical protein
VGQQVANRECDQHHTNLIYQDLRQLYLDKKMRKIKNGVADKTSSLNSNENDSCQFLEAMVWY